MKIISWNVNGFRAIEKKGFYDFVKKESPDILMLQETKINPSDINTKLGFYENQYWNCSKEKKGYSGTVIFCKEKPKKVIYDLGIKEHDIEGRVVTLEFEKFYVVNVYVPNSKRELLRLKYREKWDKDFLHYLKKLDKPVIVGGDLNVSHTRLDLANPDANYNKSAGFTQIEIDGFENMLKAGFIDTFREFHKEGEHYSYWSPMFGARARNVGWRLDYFLIPEKLRSKLKDAFILSSVMGSDHCPVGIDIIS